MILFLLYTLHKKCPHLEFFWSEFSRIRTEYSEILRIPPSSVRMRENKDQKIFEYKHFSRIYIFFMMCGGIFRALSNIYNRAFFWNSYWFYFFFYLGFLSQTFTIHRITWEGRDYSFKSSLPLLPASQTLRY